MEDTAKLERRSRDKILIGTKIVDDFTKLVESGDFGRILDYDMVKGEEEKKRFLEEKGIN